MQRFFDWIRSGFNSMETPPKNHNIPVAELARKLDGLERKLAENSEQLEILASSAAKGSDLRGKFTDNPSISAEVGNIITKLNHIIYELDFVRSRHAIYLGDGMALTYLEDRTPIVVDPRDSGPAADVLNGGLYEVNSVDTILTFC